MRKKNRLAVRTEYFKKSQVDAEKGHVMRIFADNKNTFSELTKNNFGLMEMFNKRYEDAKNEALEFFELFGKDRYYLEIQDHGINDQKLVARDLKRMSYETGIPLVATNDVHYINKSDSYNQKVLMCIQMGRTVDDPSKMEFETNSKW